LLFQNTLCAIRGRSTSASCLRRFWNSNRDRKLNPTFSFFNDLGHTLPVTGTVFGVVSVGVEGLVVKVLAEGAQCIGNT
jgi:hypothetical protein